MSDPHYDERQTIRGRRRGGPGWALALFGLVVLLGMGAAVAWLNAGPQALAPALKGAPPAVRRMAAQLQATAEQSARIWFPAEQLLAGSAGGTASYPHIVAASGKTVHAKPVRFTFDGMTLTVAPAVNSSAYWGARAASREALVPPGISSDAWSSAYYRSIALDPLQKPMFDSACEQLRSFATAHGLDRSEYLELIAKYVQSITYDKKEFASGTTRVRFPVQTVVDGKGLCEDKSLLLTALLAHEGYSAALLSFEPEKHMAVGVRGPGPTYGDTGYLFLETTEPCYVSEIPDVYDDGMKLRSEPQVVTIGEGKGQYGAAAQVQRVIEARDTAEAAARALLKEARRQSLTPAQATRINRQLKLAQEATTNLRSNVVDQSGAPVGRFLDRTQAVRWVAQNAWWL